MNFGTSQSRNTRDRMEDSVVVKTLPNGSLFAAVLDGHNGKFSVDFVSTRLYENLAASKEDSVSERLRRAYEKTESELIDKLVSQIDSNRTSEDENSFPILTSGVVVCSVIIDQKSICCASVGDCRAVLGRKDGTNLQLSVDHNVSDPIERERVKNILSNDGYVKGLMVTRSLGNVCFRTRNKIEGQIADPSIRNFPLSSDDSFLLIASDGLFDVMSNEVATSTVVRAMRRPSFSPDKAAQELVDKAVARGSSDNICVCIVILE
jgi:serine/threonine protein phosphatase PrpC